MWGAEKSCYSSFFQLRCNVLCWEWVDLASAREVKTWCYIVQPSRAMRKRWVCLGRYRCIGWVAASRKSLSGVFGIDIVIKIVGVEGFPRISSASKGEALPNSFCCWLIRGKVERKAELGHNNPIWSLVGENCQRGKEGR